MAENIEELLHVVRNYPIIDNHAHNLLRPSNLHKFPFESITTEAQGDALHDTFKSLPHIRAAKQLKELYECDDDDWENIKKSREQWLQARPEHLFRKCFQGIHTILMDDGLDLETVEDYAWHDEYTTSKTKRIVRIETVAEGAIQSIAAEQGDPLHTWAEKQRSEVFLRHFKSVFLAEILKAVADADVVGFKSVICYRTGLDVQTRDMNDDPHSGFPVLAFQAYIKDCVQRNSFRLNHKPLNDWILTIAIQGILSSAKRKIKPIQFHTGLGDNDMNLRKSNPAYLQPLIEYFPEVPIVLLHSSYPYTREAGYLACVFPNVYLDVGEVFPMISREGQLSVLSQSMELVPGNKLLWSTDGHWFPETYWLATKQFRAVLEVLLQRYIEKGDFTVAQATELAKDIMFNNSNEVYKLGLDAEFDHLRPPPSGITSRASPQRAVPALALQRSGSSETRTLKHLSLDDPALDFVYLQWIDYMGTMRARMVPIARFRQVANGQASIGMSRGNTGTLQNDTITPAVNTCGQIMLEPDLNSLMPTHSLDTLRVPSPSGGPSHSKTASVMAYWRSESGHPLPSCPRGNLDAVLSSLATDYDIHPRVGFEIEVTFLHRGPQPHTYEPLTTAHSWGTLTPQQWGTALPLLRDITTELAAMGVPIEQIHAEAGPGQYELILPHQPALAAIDTLMRARTAIQQLAHAHAGLRATFHPRPIPGAAGSGAHAHISLNGTQPAQHDDARFFVAGVLRRLRAVCALTLPARASYERIADGAWAGGTWVAWGSQNRETPLRRVRDGRWEVRCLDGMANMYIAVTAVLAAGLLGLREARKAEAAAASPVPDAEDDVFHEAVAEPAPLLLDCPHNPALLTDAQRKEYNIAARLPRALPEALEALEADAELREVLGEVFVADYVGMRRVEMEMLEKMGAEERRSWEIERY